MRHTTQKVCAGNDKHVDKVLAHVPTLSPTRQVCGQRGRSEQ